MTAQQSAHTNQRGHRRTQRDQRPEEEKLYDERVINVNRVARVVKGGRRFRFQALVVVGDRKNKVGIGVSKGADVTAAVTKATDVAKKNMVTVKLYKGTLPHDAEAKVGGAHIFIKPASAGTGLIAGGVVRTVLEVAGVQNVLSKSLGSSNKINTAYATVKALEELTPQKEWITYRQPESKKPKAENKVVVETKAKAAKPDTKKPVVKGEK